jgi:L-fuconolactonase
MPTDQPPSVPDFPIIDAHVHLWDPQYLSLPWLHGLPILQRPFLPTNLAEQSDDIPLTNIIVVEAAVAPEQAATEASWIAALAQEYPQISGFVAAVKLDQRATLPAHLAALREYGPLIKGVRHNLQDLAPDFCLQPDVIHAVELLADLDWSFDLCIRHTQLPAVVELVQRCPQTRFILDHLGKPAIAAQQLDPWRDQLAALAACPNVACKLSGMVTEADLQHWKSSDLVPYIQYALHVFGPDRVLFGGDWPVLLLASSYQTWVTTLHQLTADLDSDNQRKLWADNARHWYRLASHTPVREERL